MNLLAGLANGVAVSSWGNCFAAAQPPLVPHPMHAGEWKDGYAEPAGGLYHPCRARGVAAGAVHEQVAG